MHIRYLKRDETMVGLSSSTRKKENSRSSHNTEIVQPDDKLYGFAYKGKPLITKAGKKGFKVCQGKRPFEI